jgi:hypothetical protein
MTTMDLPSFRDFAAAKLHSRLTVRQQRKPIDSSRMANLVRLVLHLIGFVLLTVAAFEYSMIAGYVVAGVSCFVFSTLATPQAEPQNAQGR